MRYGACTWIFGDQPLAAVAPRMAGLGLDGVELYGDLALDPGETRRILADHGLGVLSITPEDPDLCHPDPAVNRPALDYYLRLVDFAAEVGAPLFACHGRVGRVRAVGSYAEEWDLMVAAAREIARRAAQRDLRVAIELLNRYESHMLNTADEGVRFLREVAAPNLGLLLDAYHMNIEEPDLPAAIQAAGPDLFLFHVADSNRQAAGRGHIDFRGLASALAAIPYTGDVVFECVAAGPDPFAALKGPGSLAQVESFIGESLHHIKALMEEAA